MEEQFISFETAKMLKDVGFEEIILPTQALAAKWIREVHGLHIFCFQTNLPYTEHPTKSWEWGYEIDPIDDLNNDMRFDMGYSTYEEAMEEGLKRALGMIKERSKV